MFSTIQVDVIDLSPKMTVFSLSDDVDLVPGASSGLLTIRLRRLLESWFPLFGYSKFGSSLSPSLRSPRSNPVFAALAATTDLALHLTLTLILIQSSLTPSLHTVVLLLVRSYHSQESSLTGWCVLFPEVSE
jgi:hypothetical protein